MEYATRLVVVVELIQIVLCIIILTNLARNDSIEFTDDESTISAASGGELQSVSNRRNFRTHVIGVLLVIVHLKRIEWNTPNISDLRNKIANAKCLCIVVLHLRHNLLHQAQKR